MVVIKEYKKMWEELNKDNNLEHKKQYFYFIRKKLNTKHSPTDFMFIMRTCVNGMPRYNKKGEFNSSFHLNRKGIKPKTLKNIVLEWSQLLNKYNVCFVAMNFEDIQCNKGDLIYIDPPYEGTKGMYYGSLKDYGVLWDWLNGQPCNYLLSFDGRITSKDSTQNIPKYIYDKHRYIYSGNSSFRRIMGNSLKEYVEESLYIKTNN